MKHKIDFESMNWETPAPGVRMKAHHEGEIRVRLVEFTKEFVEDDWCTLGHTGYVLEGRMEVEFDGSLETFGPGDGIFIPSGQEDKHMAKVLTRKVRLVLVEQIGEPSRPSA